MADAQQTATATKSGFGLPLWQKALLGLLALPLAALVLPSLMILAIGLVPSCVALIADRSRERYLAVTVALPNACGCLPALADLWALGQTYSNAQIVLSDPVGWAAAIGGAGVGWLIYLAAPSIAAVYYASAGRLREQALKRLQKTLIETWGEEITAGEKPAETESSNEPA